MYLSKQRTILCANILCPPTKKTTSANSELSAKGARELIILCWGSLLVANCGGGSVSNIQISCK